MSRRHASRAARRCLLLGLLIVLWHIPPATAEFGLRVVYDTVQTVTTRQEKGPPVEKVTRGTLIARLGTAALVVRRDDAGSVYDFATRRALALDHSKQERREYSLYAIAASRELELVNREAVNRMAAAIGLDKDVDMVDAESELSMAADPPARVHFKEESRDGARIFVINDREVTTFIASPAALPAELAPALSRLLLYEADLHPQVRVALMKEPAVPRHLEFSWRQIGERTTVVWVLREAVEEPFDAAAEGAGYAARPVMNQALLETAFRLRAGQAGAPPPAATYRERAEKLLTEGRGFEAFLVAFESSLATGDAPADLLRRARESARSDPRMQAVGRALELEQRDPKGALGQLDPVDTKGLDAGYVVDVLRANQRISLRQGDQALQLFTAALLANPFLAAPWIDAGRIFYNGYRVVTGWACWDAARAAAPGSMLLRQLDELEASLARKHPEYF